MENKINTILQMDCLEYLKRIPSNSIDLVLIDPPYGVNFKNSIYNDSKDFIKECSADWLKALYTVLKPNCHCYIFLGTKSLPFWLPNIVNAGFEFNNILNVPTFCNGNYTANNFQFRTEHIIYLSKGKAKDLNKVDAMPVSKVWFNDKRNIKKEKYTYNYTNYMQMFWANEKANKVSKNIHPNQKNAKLIKFLIELSTLENDIVLDCFAGVGSTAIAALESKRNFLGCEIGEGYCKLANDRIEKQKALNPLLVIRGF